MMFSNSNLNLYDTAPRLETARCNMAKNSMCLSSVCARTQDTTYTVISCLYDQNSKKTLHVFHVRLRLLSTSTGSLGTAGDYR